MILVSWVVFEPNGFSFPFHEIAIHWVVVPTFRHSQNISNIVISLFITIKMVGGVVSLDRPFSITPTWVLLVIYLIHIPIDIPLLSCLNPSIFPFRALKNQYLPKKFHPILDLKPIFLGEIMSNPHPIISVREDL